MPELPEVETVRRMLESRVVGRSIASVKVLEPRLRVRIATDFAASLTGQTITGVARAGKYLLFEFEGGAVWLVHLGMSGCLTTQCSWGAHHVHVSLALSDGTVLTYDDPRRFGLMKYYPRGNPPEVAALGVDPISDEFTTEYLFAHCRGRQRPIKNLLMDQSIIAGLGNIYVNEALFRAGIRPSRRGKRLSRRDVEAIRRATRAVLAEAIQLGGSSISDYRDANGKPGYFQLHLNVYDQQGKPCPRCHTPIQASVLAGRSTFYCRSCQR